MHTGHITGRSAFLALLKSEGVTHLFGNPGTTELPIMHALAEHPDLTYVMGMHESIVVGMADGFARASGGLGACNVHVAPGLGNAMGSLFNASYTNTPVLITAGQQEQGHALTEPLLAGPLVEMAAPVCKWAIEVTRLADLPRIVRRAAKVAMTPPTGPVFISLPGDILNDERPLDLGASTRIEDRVRPSDELLARLADRILAAHRPLILTGDELVGSDALAEAAQLAETIGAPSMQQGFNNSASFLSEHRCYLGLLPKEQLQTRTALVEHDLLIVLGTDPGRTSINSATEPIPDIAMIQIGLGDWDIAKNYPVEIAIRADIRETLRALIPLLWSKGGRQLAARAAARIAEIERHNWKAKRARLVAELEARPASRPIDVDLFTLRLIEALPRDVILVHEGFTSTRRHLDLFAFRDRYCYHSGGSGGIGWSIPASVGIACARMGRPVVTVVGDGSAMFSIQALWTIAHHRLPITTVICNNGGYRIIKQRLKGFFGNAHFVGMDFASPAVDFVGLAQAMGVPAERITEAGAIGPAVERATASGRPMLLDVMVDASV